MYIIVNNIEPLTIYYFNILNLIFFYKLHNKSLSQYYIYITYCISDLLYNRNIYD